ncbi:hypothetical protein [Prescottella equi]|uniref:hypothetical protein n=1 Tax=Rhodococcus hoagii TaxID=43767 RepID=UPI00384CFA7F
MPYPARNTPYFALVAPAELEKTAPYRTVTGSHFGVVLDDVRPSGAHLFSTAEAAEAYRDALPEDAFGKPHVVARLRWHGGSIFTAA